MTYKRWTCTLKLERVIASSNDSGNQCKVDIETCQVVFLSLGFGSVIRVRCLAKEPLAYKDSGKGVKCQGSITNT